MPKLHSIFLLLSLLLPVGVNCLQVDIKEPLNVGTALFSETNLKSCCWTLEQLGLLTTRMAFDDLLPSPLLLYQLDNALVNEIVEYYKLLVEIVNEEVDERHKHLTMLALSDVLGGYMRHILLPMAKFTYYAGTITQSSIRKLLQMYQELKWYLRTDGQGWADPIISETCRYSAAILSIKAPKFEKCCACDALKLYPYANDSSCRKDEFTIPLPFFDCKMKPHTLALPFLRCPLRGVDKPNAGFIILKYYVISQKCLICKQSSPYVMESFQNGLLSWIEDEVFPRFNDERFYSAFGGVLRVHDALKRIGAARVDVFAARRRYNYMSETYGIDPFFVSPWKIILLILLLVLLMALLIYCCCRKRKKRKEQESSEEDYQTRWPSKLRSGHRSKFAPSNACTCFEYLLPTYADSRSTRARISDWWMQTFGGPRKSEDELSSKQTERDDVERKYEKRPKQESVVSSAKVYNESPFLPVAYETTETTPDGTSTIGTFTGVTMAQSSRSDTATEYIRGRNASVSRSSSSSSQTPDFNTSTTKALGAFRTKRSKSN